MSKLDEVVYAGLGTIKSFSRNDDGTLAFEASKATGPDLDLDGERVDMSWARGAMEDWFASGANLREMHQAIAAGKGVTLEHREDGDYIAGVVVDPGSAVKVENGVLQGLSIGIKGPRYIKDATAPNGRIVGGKIVEVSLVDRPCLPSCKLVLGKAAASGEYVPTEELVLDDTEVPVDTEAIVSKVIEALDARREARKAEKEAAKQAKADAKAARTPEEIEAAQALKAEKQAERETAFVAKIAAVVTDTVKAEMSPAEGSETIAALKGLVVELGERLKVVEGQPAEGGPHRGVVVTPVATVVKADARAELLTKAAVARNTGDRELADSYELRASRIA